MFGTSPVLQSFDYQAKADFPNVMTTYVGTYLRGTLCCLAMDA